MTKAHILAEIKRTAEENRGIPLGANRFFSVTRIRETDWRGKYWARWGDALIEAGFQPNEWTEPHPEEYLIECFIKLVRELGHLPVKSELDLKRRRDDQFPSTGSFRRLGSSQEVILKVKKYCEEHTEFNDVRVLCEAKKFNASIIANVDSLNKIGFVYLLKHGSRAEYKIGKTLNPLRREGEIGIQLPNKVEPIHYIQTDDPSGIENYWHVRFKDKRKEGEWFELTPSDVKAFKRWRSIY